MDKEAFENMKLFCNIVFAIMCVIVIAASVLFLVFKRSMLPIWTFLITIQQLGNLLLVSYPMPAMASVFFGQMMRVVRLQAFGIQNGLKRSMGMEIGMDALDLNFKEASYNSKSAYVLLGYFTFILLAGIFFSLGMLLLDVVKESNADLHD